MGRKAAAPAAHVRRHAVCSALRKDGEPCTAPATSSDGRFCLSHDPERRELVEAARMKGGHATWKPRLSELLAQRVEDEADVIISAYLDALYDPDADHETRMRAADRLMDRVYGKPRQGVELSGPDGSPLGGTIGQQVVDDPEARRLAGALRDRLMQGDSGPVRMLGE